MDNISDSLVEKIKQLGDGSIEDQKNACKLIREKIFVKNCCINGSVIPKLLPLIVRLITSEDESLQQNAASFVEIITSTSDSHRNDKENTQLVIDHNATENLLNCLSSSQNEAVILRCLKCLVNISYDFPAEIINKNALRSIIAFLKMKNTEVLDAAATILVHVTLKCEEKDIRLVIGLNATENLVKCLSFSNKEDVVLQCLSCLINISCYFPAEIIEQNALPSVIHCLKSKKPNIFHRAAEILMNVAEEFGEGILSVLESCEIATFKNLLELSSKSDEVFEVVCAAMINIVRHNAEACQYVLDLGILKLMETTFKRLFDDAKKSTTKRKSILSGKMIDTREIQERMKIMVVQFILNATHFNEKQVDMVLDKNFVPLILKLIGGKASDEIKNASILVMDNIIKKKPRYVPNLINDDIISLLYNNLETQDSVLLKTVLTTLENLIRFSGKSIRQKIIEYGKPEMRQNLLQREDLNELPKDIHSFVYVKLEPGIFENVDANESVEHEKVHSVTFDTENNSESEEVSNNYFNYNDFDQETVNTETSNGQTTESSGSKRALNASEQAEPVCKRRRNDQSSNGNVFYNSSGGQLSLFESSPESENAITPSSADQSVVPGLPEATTSVEINRNQNAFAPFKYNVPSEAVIDDYCKKLGLEFDRIKFRKLCSEIVFETITCDSKPKDFYPTNDKSGFGCFSLFFTGTELNAENIQDKLSLKYIRYLPKKQSSNNEKLLQIADSDSMTSEHFETIVRWLKCKIMVYSDENGWEKYGDWNSEDKLVPIFVLKKMHSGNKSIFEIVLSFD